MSVRLEEKKDINFFFLIIKMRKRYLKKNHNLSINITNKLTNIHKKSRKKILALHKLSSYRDFMKFYTRGRNITFVTKGIWHW